MRSCSDFFVFGMNLFWLPLNQVTGSLVPKSETYLMTLLLELIPTISLQNRVRIRRHFPIYRGSWSCSSETQAPGMTILVVKMPRFGIPVDASKVWQPIYRWFETNSRELEMMWGHLRPYSRFVA